jgi:ribonuclease G
MYTEEDDDEDDETPSDEQKNTIEEKKILPKNNRQQKKNNRQKSKNNRSNPTDAPIEAEIVAVETIISDEQSIEQIVEIPAQVEPTQLTVDQVQTNQTSEKGTTKKKPNRNKKKPKDSNPTVEVVTNEPTDETIVNEIKDAEETVATVKEVIPPEVRNPAMLLPNRRKITIVGSKITEDNQFEVVDSKEELIPQEVETTTPSIKSKRVSKKNPSSVEQTELGVTPEPITVDEQTTSLVVPKKRGKKSSSAAVTTQEPSIPSIEPVESSSLVTPKRTVKKGVKPQVVDIPLVEEIKSEPIEPNTTKVNRRKSTTAKTIVETTAIEEPTLFAIEKKPKRISAKTVVKNEDIEEVTEETTKKPTARKKKTTTIPFAAEVSDDVVLEIPLDEDGSELKQPKKNGKQKNQQPKAPAPLPTFNTKRSGQVTINLTPKQMIPVQVVRDAYSSKGVRVTTRITIPGRNVVFLPFDNVIGVSKKINSSKERRRLRRLAQEILPKGSGCIIRTAAQGQTEDDLRRDWEELLVKWDAIEKKLATAEKPTILYNDVNTSTKVIRDLFTENVDAVVIDSYKIYKEIHSYVQWASPQLLDKIVYYTEKRPLFDAYGIEKDIMMLPNRKIYLPSGGSIVIDPTEALVAIDVNTGRATKDKLQEQNAFKTNMEALYEVARQLRLRDIGGMVIVDFIDMMYDENRRKLYHEMTRELNKDRAKTVVYPLTQLGLMQITRQRIRQNIMAVVTEDCTHCRGTGKVYSRSVVLNSLERWLRNYKTTSSAFSIHLLVHPDLGAILTAGDFSLLQKLMLKYFIRIKLHYSTDLPFNEFQFVPIDQE